jgi:ATP-binding cassette subfamily F protein 3
MHSCDLLIEALNKYEGSLLLVSHDRYFISKTANKIWEIDDHLIREFKGTYEEWVDWKERNLAAKLQAAAMIPTPVSNGRQPDSDQKPAAGMATTPQAARQSVPPPKMATPGGKPSAPDGKPSAPAGKLAGAPINKEAKKELQRQQRLFEELEQKLASLSAQKDRLEAALAEPATYSDRNKFVAAETEYKKTSDELGKTNRQYEQVFEKIVQLEKTL